MTVARYMKLCLGHETYGYYRSQNPIGQRGDFITSPEISQIFGELLGLWCAEVWRAIGSPTSYNLIELGPGRGTLMSDFLRALRVRQNAYTAAEVHLVETSPVLKACQKDALSNESVNCNWHDDIGSIPSRPAILIANEFLDALPIHQFEWHDDGWRERRINLNSQNDLCFVGSETSDTPGHWFESADPIQLDYLNAIGCKPHCRQNGEIFEIRVAARRLVEKLSRQFNSETLVALFLDYGHVKSGSGVTLQAVRKHKFVDPLQFPGTADLTAHVDFADLARTAKHFALGCSDPLDQSQFLLSLGLVPRLETLMKTAQHRNDERLSEQLKSGAERLVDPQQMGELFKVIMIRSPSLPLFQPFTSEFGMRI